jgi:SAM-dependent methyltransferase
MAVACVRYGATSIHILNLSSSAASGTIGRPAFMSVTRNLQLGCLASAPASWENTDVTPHIFVARIPGAARLLRSVGLMSAERYAEHRAGVFARIRYLNAAKRFPFQDQSFDNVFSCHMLEHLYRDEAEQCVREVRRVLKPGGVFRVVVPDLDLLVRAYDERHPEGLLQKVYENTQRFDKNRHHWMYTHSSMRELLQLAGFSHIERCSYQQGRCPDVDKLDSRPEESLFMEGVK